MDNLLTEDKKTCPLGKCDGSGIIELNHEEDFAVQSCYCVTELSDGGYE